MAITNKQLITSIVANGSTNLQNAFKNVDVASGAECLKAISNFEGLKNEFIDSLIGRIVKTQFFSKVYNNPLKMLHNGMLNYGESIQQIFVDMGERKGFQEHFASKGGSEENDLIGKKIPVVHVDYITKNFAHKYKVTVSQAQLQTAFMSENGLSSLVEKLISSNISKAYFDEYEDMKGILTRETKEDNVKDGHRYDKGVIFQIAEDTTIKDKAVVKLGKSYTPKDICKTVREYSRKLQFCSDNYNLAKVKTFTNPNELIFFTTSDVESDIDVSVLAHAFNVSSTDIKTRTIILDEIPNINGDKVLGILADKDVIQAWDTINQSASFFNADQLTTNYFLHKQGIMATCKFAQCVVITDGTK